MPRRERPKQTERSEHWMRIAANEDSAEFNQLLIAKFGWDEDEQIRWLSPIKSDDYAEYFDESFLERLGIGDLSVPLSNFWPRSGARWDGLAKTDSGKVILVEAKAYIEEGVDYRSKAERPESIAMITRALNDAKASFRANNDAPWEAPFYQYTNRLAHLYFLSALNQIDTYLVFLYFADAPDVPKPSSVAEWEGAARLTEKCLGLSNRHPFKERIATIIWRVPEMPFYVGTKD